MEAAALHHRWRILALLCAAAIGLQLSTAVFASTADPLPTTRPALTPALASQRSAAVRAALDAGNAKRATAIARNLLRDARASADAATLAIALRAQCLVDEHGNQLLSAFQTASELVTVSQQLDPADADRVFDLLRLGVNALPVNRPDVAEAALDQIAGQSMRLKLAPTVQADVLILTGATAVTRGAWRGGAEAFEQARALLSTREPDDIRMMRIAGNLGLVALNRGDLAEARTQLDTALALADELSPPPFDRARILHTYGQVEYVRGALEQAIERFQAALNIERALNPLGLAYATTQLALAQTLARSGRTDAAARSYAQALQVVERQDAHCQCLGPTLIDIGYFDLAQGRLTLAKQRFARAIALIEVAAPGSLLAASAWRAEAEVLLASNELPAATARLQQALAVEQAAADGTTTLAATHFLLGRALAAGGAGDAARDHYCRAATALDKVKIPFAGENYSQARFRSQFSSVYSACVRAELQAGRVDAAFEALERSRARGFLNALQERDLVLPDSGRSELARRLLAAHPALDGRAARRTLSADAVAISFDVGDHDTVVFVVDRRRIRAVTIALGHAALAERVEQLRQAIQTGSIEAVRAESSTLYDLLLAPLRLRLAATRALLISPDDVLHELPFAALWDLSVRQWLIEQAPISIVDSLSARAALKSPSRSGTVLAVGDPALNGAAGDNAERHSLLQGLSPLPGARAEVQALALQFKAAAHLLLGDAATEAAVRRAAPKAALLHFAVHAVYDPLRPSQSALMLARGPNTGSEDGLLHIWEVFEQFRLDANLIVLSACETARGERFDGEGLLGFSRAFQFAGARAVMASLWRIDDSSTAVLMRNFYADADLQRMPAAALRRATLALINGNSAAAPAADTDTRGVGGLTAASSVHDELAHPYHWAGFQIYGR